MKTLTAATGPRGLVATATLLALASSFGAVSAADTTSVSVNVRFADLNLSSPAGALVLYDRIHRAAEGACSYYWFKTDADQNRCVHHAIADAVTRVNHPGLSAVYNAKHNTPLPTLVTQSR